MFAFSGKSAELFHSKGKNNKYLVILKISHRAYILTCNLFTYLFQLAIYYSPQGMCTTLKYPSTNCIQNLVFLSSVLVRGQIKTKLRNIGHNKRGWLLYWKFSRFWFKTTLSVLGIVWHTDLLWNIEVILEGAFLGTFFYFLLCIIEIAIL